MITKILKFLLALVLMLLPLMLHASDCDNLYKQAVGYRQTMTVDAQNKAIALFQQARECYTDSTERARCDRQIDMCIRSIKRLGGTPILNANEAAPADEDIPTANIDLDGAEANPAQSAASPVETPANPEAVVPINTETDEPAKAEPAPATEVTPAPAETRMEIKREIQFDANPDEPYVLGIDGNEHFKVKAFPSWVKIDIDNENNRITITAERNTGKERSDIIYIVGSETIFNIEVTQKKKGLF